PRQLPPGRGQAARRDVVAADPADALRTLRQDARRVSVVLGAVPADEHAVSGADDPAVGFGESLRRLLEEAGRSLRTLKRWTKRWRWRALEAVPWLASLSVTANPQSGLLLDSAGEALPESRRVVAEELRWLNACQGRNKNGSPAFLVQSGCGLEESSREPRTPLRSLRVGLLGMWG